MTPFIRQESQGSSSYEARKNDVVTVAVKTQSNLATITRAKSKDGRRSLYNIPSVEMDPEYEKLLNNIYDATPDHSILKHGMAKSLSNFHLGELRYEGQSKLENII